MTVVGDAGGGAFLTRDDKGKEKRLHFANEYDICERKESEVCPGDKLMVGANVKSKDGNFINGEIVKVSGFDENGGIRVSDGLILDAKILSYGYASASHKSQGSLCDAVILGISARSASNFAGMKLACVGATRGRESSDVYCEDKSLLYEIGSRTGRSQACEMPGNDLTWMRPASTRNGPSPRSGNMSALGISPFTKEGTEARSNFPNSTHFL